MGRVDKGSASVDPWDFLVTVTVLKPVSGACSSCTGSQHDKLIHLKDLVFFEEDFSKGCGTKSGFNYATFAASSPARRICIPLDPSRKSAKRNCIVNISAGLLPGLGV